MSLDQQLALVRTFRETLGLYVTLSVTAAEAKRLTAEDVADLRALGATDGLLDDLRVRAFRHTDVTFELDFEAQTVTLAD